MGFGTAKDRHNVNPKKDGKRMFNVVGRISRRVYGTSKTRAGAEKMRLRVAIGEFVNVHCFRVVGPVCKFCGKACPCGKAKNKSSGGRSHV